MNQMRLILNRVKLVVREVIVAINTLVMKLVVARRREKCTASTSEAIY